MAVRVYVTVQDEVDSMTRTVLRGRRITVTDMQVIGVPEW